MSKMTRDQFSDSNNFFHCLRDMELASLHFLHDEHKNLTAFANMCFVDILYSISALLLVEIP